MSIGLIFWVLMLLWIISVIGGTYAPAQLGWMAPAGNIFILILFFLLGWRVFGFIIQGSLPFPSTPTFQSSPPSSIGSTPSIMKPERR